MILSAQSIRKRCTGDTPMIAPFHERALHAETGMTYGLGPASYDLTLDQSIVLGPGKFALASVAEGVAIPHDIKTTIHDKSTLARRGLNAFCTVTDPGFCGFLTLELVNNGSEVIRLPKGSPIVQLVFARLDEPTEQPYAGKYQHQARGPQVAI